MSSICEALGVSPSGFQASLAWAPSARVRSDEEFSAEVRASFSSSYRTYGACQVWHDLLAEGQSLWPHRIERLMRVQGLRARPRLRGLPKDYLFSRRAVGWSMNDTMAAQLVIDTLMMAI